MIAARACVSLSIACLVGCQLIHKPLDIDACEPSDPLACSSLNATYPREGFCWTCSSDSVCRLAEAQGPCTADIDGGPADAGPDDAMVDSGADAGLSIDAGVVDSGVDSGVEDAGLDSGADAGPMGEALLQVTSMPSPLSVGFPGGSNTVSVTITNMGTRAASGVGFSGVSGPFSAASHDCDDLAPTESCEFSATFMPPGIGLFTQDVSLGYTSDGSSMVGVDFSLSAYGVTSGGPLALTVAPVYPTHGADWNDYVQRDSASNSPYSQTDTACSGSEDRHWKCMHGGELRVVLLPGASSCDGLTFTDDLDTFNWICTEDFGAARLFSTGLKPGRGLRNLVHSSGWQPNKIEVRIEGALQAESTAGAWYGNSVTIPPNNSSIGSGVVEDLTGEGTIYVISAHQDTAGYNIDANRIALVTLDASTLQWSSPAAGNCDLYGDIENADSGSADSRRCMIGAKSQNFLWIEGDFDGRALAENLITNVTVRHSRFHNIVMSNGVSNGHGLRLADNTRYNVVENLIAHHAGSFGLSVDGSYNIIHNVIATNHGISDINLDGEFNTFTQIFSASSGAFQGISAYDQSDDTTFAFVTVMNARENGIELFRNERVSISSIVAINNGTVGIIGDGNVFDVGYLRAANLFSTNNGGHAISLINAYDGDNRISGHVVVGNNGGACQGGAGYGILNNCNPEGDSTHVLETSVASAETSIVGKLTENDSENESDQDFGAPIMGSSVIDWVNFESRWRAWGRNGGDFPSAGNREVCETSSSCVVWDYRLRATDTTIRNRSGDGVLGNDPFVADSACPLAVHGSEAFTDQQGNTYLLNAIEIISDFVGDDDGLCESNETCIYAPNWGAYQGEGDYLAGGTCLFTPGTITGVRMYAYPQNGI